MATIAEIKALMDSQKADDVQVVKDEFAPMKAALATELRAELRELVQQEISKNIGEVEAHRMEGCLSLCGDSFVVSAVSASRPRTFYPRLRTRHLEPVHEVIACPWWDNVLSKLLAALHPDEITIRTFHDYIVLVFSDAMRCTRCAVALRNFNFTLTTRAGSVELVVVIRDRPRQFSVAAAAFTPTTRSSTRRWSRLARTDRFTASADLTHTPLCTRFTLPPVQFVCF